MMERWSEKVKLSNLESAMATLMEAFRHTITLIRADPPPREMIQKDGGWKARSDETNGLIYNNKGKSGRKLEIVRLKTEELRQRSSPSNPLCFRCGKPGHLAYYCPNSIVCFVCGRHGHRARECSSPQVELVTEDTTYLLEIGQTTKMIEKGEQEIEEAEWAEVVNQKNAFTEVTQKIEMSNLEIQRLSKELLETKVELGVCKEEYILLKRSFDNMISGLKVEKDKLIATITVLEGKISDDLKSQLVAISKERDDLMSTNEKLCSELHEADMLRKNSDNMLAQLQDDKNKLVANITALNEKLHDGSIAVANVTTKGCTGVNTKKVECEENEGLQNQKKMEEKIEEESVIRGKELDVRSRNILESDSHEQKIEVLSGSEEKKLIKNKMKKTQSAKGRQKKVKKKIFQTEPDGEGGIVIKLVDPG